MTFPTPCPQPQQHSFSLWLKYIYLTYNVFISGVQSSESVFIYYVSWNDHSKSSYHLLASEQLSLVNWAASRSHLEKEFHCQKERKKFESHRPETGFFRGKQSGIKNLSMGLVRSISSDSDALTSWGLVDPGETVPPRISQFAQVVKGSPVNTAFTQQNQSIQIPYPKHSLHQVLTKLSQSRQLFPCPNQSRAQDQTSREPYAPEPTESFRELVSLMPAFLSPLCSCGNHSKGSAHVLSPSASWLTPVLAGRNPAWWVKYYLFFLPLF